MLGWNSINYRISVHVKVLQTELVTLEFKVKCHIIRTRCKKTSRLDSFATGRRNKNPILWVKQQPSANTNSGMWKPHSLRPIRHLLHFRQLRKKSQHWHSCSAFLLQHVKCTLGIMMASIIMVNSYICMWKACRAALTEGFSCEKVWPESWPSTKGTLAQTIKKGYIWPLLYEFKNILGIGCAIGCNCNHSIDI